MPNSVAIPVQYKGREVMIPGKLIRFGFDFRFYFNVHNTEVIIEKDEEGGLRALWNEKCKVDLVLVKAVIEVLENLKNVDENSLK